MAPRLKVFVTSDGLTDYVVATTSKAKALAAWGIRQDIFKEGLAHETDDPELAAAASAQPGEVLRRPAAGRAELARLKAAPRKAAKAGPRAEKSEPRPALERFKPPPKPKGPSKAALKKVAELESRLAKANAEYEQAKFKLARDRAELERREKALDADHAAQRRKLDAALSAARRALERRAPG